MPVSASTGRGGYIVVQGEGMGSVLATEAPVQPDREKHSVLMCRALGYSPAIDSRMDAIRPYSHTHTHTYTCFCELWGSPGGIVTLWGPPFLKVLQT